MPTIQNRRATAAQWTAANPVLAAGEIGFELDTNKVKVGDGLKAWAALAYLVDEAALKLINDATYGTREHELAVSLSTTAAVNNPTPKLGDPMGDGRAIVQIYSGSGKDDYYQKSIAPTAWDGGAGPTAPDGSPSQRLVATAAETGQLILIHSPLPKKIPAASLVCGYIWVEDPAAFTGINLIITGPGGTTARWIRSITGNAVPLRAGWNKFILPAMSGTLTDWGTISRIDVQVVAKQATSLAVSRMWFEAPPKARMIFVEDRGYRTFINDGLPALRQRGIPVTWALDMALNSPDKTGVHITDEEVLQFAAEGDQMSIHAYDGAVTKTMTPEQIRTDALRSQGWLIKKGLPPTLFRAAYTQNEAPNAFAANPYFSAQATSTGSAGGLETWPPANANNVSRYQLHQRTNEQIDAIFARLKATRSLWIPYTHGITATGTSNITPESWAYFLTKVDQAIAEGWLEATTWERMLKEHKEGVAAKLTAQLLPRSKSIPSLGNDWVALGDSLTSPSGGAPSGGAWVDYLRFRTAGRFYLLNNAGVPGDNTAMMLARLHTDVLAHNPRVVTFLGGTNDLTQGVTLDTYKSNVTRIVDRIAATGATTVILSIPPRGLTDKKLAQTAVFNAWLKAFARERNLHFVDIHARLVDPATGSYKAGLGHDDNLHLSRAGAAVIGDALNEQLSPFMPHGGVVRPATNVDPNNLVLNGLLLDGTDASPTSWSFNALPAGVTRSRVDDSSFRGGKAWETVFTAPSADVSTTFTQNLADGWQVGDRLLFVARFSILESPVLPMSGAGGQKGLAISAMCYGAPTGAVQHAAVYQSLSGHHGVAYKVIDIPEGTTGPVQLSTSVAMPAGATGKFRVGELGVYNVTTLGSIY